MNIISTQAPLKKSICSTALAEQLIIPYIYILEMFHSMFDQTVSNYSRYPGDEVKMHP